MLVEISGLLEARPLSLVSVALIKSFYINTLELVEVLCYWCTPSRDARLTKHEEAFSLPLSLALRTRVHFERNKQEVSRGEGC